jgi:hypothetical protein
MGVLRRAVETQQIKELEYRAAHGDRLAKAVLIVHNTVEPMHPAAGQIYMWDALLNEDTTVGEKIVAVPLGLFDTFLMATGAHAPRPKPKMSVQTGGALKFVEQNAVSTGERALAASGEWEVLRGGGKFNWQQNVVRVKKVGNYWIKEVNPEAVLSGQRFGQSGLEQQVRYLTLLGDDAPSFLYKNGRLITRDVGQFTGSRFELLKIRLKGSWRLGTPINDIVRKNIGATRQIFDPAINPYYTVPIREAARGTAFSAERYILQQSLDER